MSSEKKHNKYLIGAAGLVGAAAGAHTGVRVGAYLGLKNANILKRKFSDSVAHAIHGAVVGGGLGGIGGGAAGGTAAAVLAKRALDRINKNKKNN